MVKSKVMVRDVVVDSVLPNIFMPHRRVRTRPFLSVAFVRWGWGYVVYIDLVTSLVGCCGRGIPMSTSSPCSASIEFRQLPVADVSWSLRCWLGPVKTLKCVINM